LIGVEHFYIYDNESSVPIKERLNNFKDICTIIDYPGKIKQLSAYNDCLKKYGKDSKWMIFIDGDEYILPKKHNNLKDFLQEYDDYYAVGINWVMFGSSFHDKKQNGFLIDKYRYRNKNQNQHIKSIVKPEYTIEFDSNPHCAKITDETKYVDPTKKRISGPFNNNNTIDIIQINHYYEKSVEEQMEKQKRGHPDSIEMHYKPAYHKENNDVKDDLLPDKYLDMVKQKYNSLMGVNGLV
jgi:hypothetical protein